MISAGRLVRALAGQPAVLVEDLAVLVDRRQHRQALALAQLEVLAAAARRDVDDAGSLLERDLVPGDDPVLDVAREAGSSANGPW